jgi:hypothetical protein
MRLASGDRIASDRATFKDREKCLVRIGSDRFGMVRICSDYFPQTQEGRKQFHGTSLTGRKGIDQIDPVLMPPAFKGRFQPGANDIQGHVDGHHPFAQ